MRDSVRYRVYLVRLELILRAPVQHHVQNALRGRRQQKVRHSVCIAPHTHMNPTESVYRVRQVLFFLERVQRQRQRVSSVLKGSMQTEMLDVSLVNSELLPILQKLMQMAFFLAMHQDRVNCVLQGHIKTL